MAIPRRPLLARTLVCLIALLPISCSGIDLEDVTADTCRHLEAQLDAVGIDTPPHTIVNDYTARVGLRESQMRTVLYTLAPTQCPGTLAAADEAYDADRLRTDPPPTDAERADALNQLSVRVAGHAADERVIEAIEALTMHYCRSGVDDDVRLVWLAKIAAGRGDEIPGMFYETDGYKRYEQVWTGDGITAAARDLPPHPDTRDAFGLAVSGSRWSDLADLYCWTYERD